MCLGELDGYPPFDIFINQVCKGLYLTEGMINRSKRMEIDGNLLISTISPEDIFLFKGITPRPGDLDDMFLLLQKDLDWNLILDEIRAQPDHFKWIGDLYNRTGELEEQYNVHIPIRENISEESELSVAICSILQILDSRTIEMTDLDNMLDDQEMELIDQSLNILMEINRIEIKDNIISLKEDQ